MSLFYSKERGESNIKFLETNNFMFFVINIKLDKSNNVRFEINWMTLTLPIYLSENSNK